jgi:glycosyltransferase involved in cell wall biosynthesis
VRIAYVCADPGVPVFGRKGCSIHVQEVIRALRSLGCEVELLAARTGGESPDDLDSLCVHRLACSPLTAAEDRERAAAAVNPMLSAALDREGPFDLVYERHSLWSFAAMEFARRAEIPGIIEVNAPLVEEQERYRGLGDRAGAEEATERAFAAASAVLAVSVELARSLEAHASARGKTHVVANGVRVERFPEGLEPLWPRDADSFTVGFLGTLKPWHGLAILAEAFAALHDVDGGARLLVVGDGPGRAALERDLASCRALEEVHITGAVAPDEVPRWLASMDAAVAPYPAFSGFYFSPLKVFEYMAAGLPIIASRVGQLAELLEDGSDALLCTPGDPAAIARALDRLRRDPELRRRLGRATRKKAALRHSWTAVAERILQIAGDVSSARRPASGELA